MADEKKPAAQSDLPKQPESTKAESPPKALSKIEEEREKDVLIGRLKTENKALLAELEAMRSLESEREAASAAAKADKASKAARTPIAKVPVMGEGRRMVKVGESLTAAEAATLREGEHFELVVAADA